MKSLWVAILSAFLVVGVSASVIAQQTGASSSAESQATKPAEDKATSSSSSSSSPVKDESQPAASARTDSQPPAAAPAPAPDKSSSSSSTTVDIKGDTGKSDIGSASPRTSVESRRIFGLEPTAALLIGAAILLVVILALVAMARGGSEPTHTDVDLRR